MPNLEEKISNILNENPKSPLFIRAVDKKLHEEDYSGAMELLQKNIIRFTDYPTALILYGETLAANGFFKEAGQNIKKASEILNSDNTYKYYLERLERYRSIRKDSDEDSFMMDGAADDELENLAKELTGAKISENKEEIFTKKKEEIEEIGETPIDETPKPEKPKSPAVFNFFGGDDLISETLAGIYFAQGNLKEAKSIYEKLRALQPDNEAHFRKKIAEIDEAMKNRNE